MPSSAKGEFPLWSICLPAEECQDSDLSFRIPIHERVELPSELIPEDSRVEIDAKITAGKPIAVAWKRSAANPACVM